MTQPYGTVDVLAVGAHPDDVEVGIGGLMHKLVSGGLGVGILDLTRGELGSRGSAEERETEAARAAGILGVCRRLNAGLPDGGLANTVEQRLPVIEALRALRPQMLLAPYHGDRHPDHEAAHPLVRDANYFAGLARIQGENPPHRAERVYYYRVYEDPTPPQLIIDVSSHFDAKLNALEAYTSQFHNPGYDGPETYVASREFWEAIQRRAAYWGSHIRTAFAEVLYAPGPVQVEAPPGIGGL